MTNEVTNNNILMVLFQCFIVFISAYGAGRLPMFISASGDRISKMHEIGTGLLLGTVFAVIIPEGIELLFEKDEHEISDAHENKLTLVGPALLTGWLFMLFVDNFWSGKHEEHQNAPHVNSRLSNNTKTSELHVEVELEETHYANEEHDGFISNAISVGENGIEQPTTSNTLVAKLSIGLIIHAAADGLAIGASQAIDQTGKMISGIVVFAIMMHKMPAAFALTAYLQARHIPSCVIHKTLIVFALAAPLTAMLTYAALSNGLVRERFGNAFVSFAILFSGGTFLYISLVHVFGELSRVDGSLSVGQMAVIGGTSVLPWLISLLHDH